MGADITYDPVLVSGPATVHNSCALNFSLLLHPLDQRLVLCNAGDDESRWPFYRRAHYRNGPHSGASPCRPTSTSFSRFLHAHASKSVFQALLDCTALSGFDVQQLDISGRPRLFDVDDSLVQQLKLRARPEVLNPRRSGHE